MGAVTPITSAVSDFSALKESYVNVFDCCVLVAPSPVSYIVLVADGTVTANGTERAGKRKKKKKFR